MFLLNRKETGRDFREYLQENRRSDARLPLKHTLNAIATSPS